MKALNQTEMVLTDHDTGHISSATIARKRVRRVSQDHKDHREPIRDPIGINTVPHKCGTVSLVVNPQTRTEKKSTEVKRTT